MPSKCPICGGDVKREVILDKKKQQSAAHYCTNKNCFAIEKEQIIHFVSKKGFGIEGLGEKIVEQLIEEGLISSSADIFALKKGDLKPLERFAEKSAENLIEAIEQSKKIALEKFLFALGIRHFGEESAILIKNNLLEGKKLSNPSELIDAFNEIDQERLEQINGVGGAMAQSIVAWFGEKENRKLLKKMTYLGVVFLKGEKTAQIGAKLNGQTFVLTGTLQNLTRDQAKDLIRKAGGRVSSSVSSKTDFVVIGKDPGSKAQKAGELGVRKIEENEFASLVKSEKYKEK